MQKYCGKYYIKTYFPHFSIGIFFEFHFDLNSSSDMSSSDIMSFWGSDISV